jgi:hypothetical protein
MLRIHLAVLALLLYLGYPPLAGAVNPGHVDWNEWSFDYQVLDKAGGLALENVHYRGTKIIHRASLPVVRVEYNGDECGPFDDMIPNDNSCDVEFPSPDCLLKISDCDNDRLCLRSFTTQGVEWLEIAVLARIGAYRLYQAWYLGRDGSIDPRLSSKGIATPVNHRHHPYWRIDFEVNGKSKNEVWVFEDDGPAVKQGNQWFYKKAAPPHKLTVEGAWKKSENAFPDVMNRRWFVKDPVSGQGVWVIPGQHDGRADDFSKADIALRLWKNEEDIGWEFGGGGGLGYDNNENVENDVVFWYIAHLPHDVDVDDVYHSAGPRLKVNSAPSLAIIKPTDGESVGYGGLNFVKFEASVSDVEDGAKCCSVSWKSDKDGPIGPEHVFLTPGNRVITATAKDNTGATAIATITLKVGNSPPTVQIVKPETAAVTSFRNMPLQLEATSTDYNESFLQLPCSALTWTSSKSGDFSPAVGCAKVVQFTTTGIRTITVTGKDSEGLTGKDAVTVNVIDVLPNSAPVVIIQSPANNLRADPFTTWTLKGKGTDPDGNTPLTYKWVLKKGSVPQETILGTTPIVSWKPMNNIPPSCGGETVEVWLFVTDADGQTGKSFIKMTADYPPC